MLNDPVLLKLADDRYWLSIADSDLLLYVKGLIIGGGFDARAFEPDVNPLAIQGPKAEDLMADLFGAQIRELKFYRYTHIDVFGSRQIIARSGFSSMDGFEIYLADRDFAEPLWDMIMSAGEKYNIAPGGPNQIDRIEGGLLGYGNEMTMDNNPLEMGFGKFCNLTGDIDCIGREALLNIQNAKTKRHIRGVTGKGANGIFAVSSFGNVACPICSTPWPVYVGAEQVGQITSAIWSPRLKTNVWLIADRCGSLGSGNTSQRYVS